MLSKGVFACKVKNSTCCRFAHMQQSAAMAMRAELLSHVCMLVLHWGQIVWACSCMPQGSHKPDNYSRYCPAVNHLDGHMHISENMATPQPNPVAFAKFMDVWTTTFATTMMYTAASHVTHAWLCCVAVLPPPLGFLHTHSPFEHPVSSEFGCGTAHHCIRPRIKHPGCWTLRYSRIRVTRV